MIKYPVTISECRPRTTHHTTVDHVQLLSVYYLPRTLMHTTTHSFTSHAHIL